MMEDLLVWQEFCAFNFYSVNDFNLSIIWKLLCLQITLSAVFLAKTDFFSPVGMRNNRQENELIF